MAGGKNKADACWDDGAFPPAAQIITAPSHARRAAIILRLPDALTFTHAEPLMAACRDTGFAAGAEFILIRSTAFSAVRQIDGRLPAAIAAAIQTARAVLIDLVTAPALQDHSASSPTGRTRRASRSARPAASFPGGGG